MPDTATSQPDHAARIAKIIGVPLAADAPGHDRALIVLFDLGPETKSMAERKGAMIFVPAVEERAVHEVVVPLDGTASAEAVLPFAVRVAQAEHAAIRLLAPAGETYVLTGTPTERYVKVLVNTMREQRLNVSGDVVSGDLLTAVGAEAIKSEGLVALSARNGGDLSGSLFQPDAWDRLQGAPVLFFSPP